MVTKTPIPANIRRIRTSRGLVQQMVADDAGISRPAFRSIETGAAEPRVSTLMSIARALSVELSELLAEPPHLCTVRFRSSKARTRKSQATREQVVFEVARRLKDFNDLEELLGERKTYALAGLSDDLSGVSARKRPVEAARLARKALELRDDEPIRDIRGLLESASVKVLTMVLDIGNLFGLSVGTGDGGPAVVVNVRDDISIERRIFTAAHELGHLLLHPRAYDVTKVDEDANEEKQADQFAAQFLMPDDIFRKEWSRTSGLSFVDRVLHVKRIFRVSYKTVLFRLGELKFANPKTIWAIFSAQYRRQYGVGLTGKAEPDAIVEAKGGMEPKGLESVDFIEDRLSRLVRQAVQSDKITLSRGAEILGVDLRAMRERAVSWEIAA